MLSSDVLARTSYLYLVRVITTYSSSLEAPSGIPVKKKIRGINYELFTISSDLFMNIRWSNQNRISAE